MAVVYETGNHIAHISDGRSRRQCAQSFVVLLPRNYLRRREILSSAQVIYGTRSTISA
jgi:hypothetical protein